MKVFMKNRKWIKKNLKISFRFWAFSAISRSLWFVGRRNILVNFFQPHNKQHKQLYNTKDNQETHYLEGKTSIKESPWDSLYIFSFGLFFPAHFHVVRNWKRRSQLFGRSFLKRKIGGQIRTSWKVFFLFVSLRDNEEMEFDLFDE